MTPRYYQFEAIGKCAEHFTSKSQEHAVCVLPTGAGKSVVISRIVEQVGGNFLVLQPSKEILEQNIAKYRALGKEASIYSAILGQRVRSQVTFATIGSIMTKREIFNQYKQIIIDECHVVNPKGGQYEYFLSNVPGLVCVGLTATPYRLKSSGNTSVIEFLTRIRPAFFKKVIHVTQQSELLEAGFLSPIQYKRRHEINLNNVVVKGNEYEENSLMREYRRVRVEDLIIQEIELLEKERKSVLVFTEFIDNLQRIKAKRPDIHAVTGATPTDERADILERFKTGQIQTLINVGVLTTGFDYPALDSIIVAKATKSLSLWYQIIGRGQRIAEGKDNCLVVDMCGNLGVLGDVQKLEVLEINGKWIVKQGQRVITNKAF
jgi:DNA repair protein RadD